MENFNICTISTGNRYKNKNHRWQATANGNQYRQKIWNRHNTSILLYFVSVSNAYVHHM